jgi:hypothetical protein
MFAVIYSFIRKKYVSIKVGAYEITNPNDDTSNYIGILSLVFLLIVIVTTGFYFSVYYHEKQSKFISFLSLFMAVFVMIFTKVEIKNN